MFFLSLLELWQRQLNTGLYSHSCRLRLAVDIAPERSCCGGQQQLSAGGSCQRVVSVQPTAAAAGGCHGCGQSGPQLCPGTQTEREREVGEQLHQQQQHTQIVPACTVEQRADVLIRIPLFILNPDCTEMIIGVDIFSRLCVWECGIYKALSL